MNKIIGLILFGSACLSLGFVAAAILAAGQWPKRLAGPFCMTCQRRHPSCRMPDCPNCPGLLCVSPNGKWSLCVRRCGYRTEAPAAARKAVVAKYGPGA